MFGVERLEGYRDAFEAVGRDVEDSLVRLDQPTADGGHRATSSLLSEHPDAIYVATDVMAAGAFRALSERGLRVPDDVAIVGFDGLPRGARLEPPLTTVVQPVAEVGRTAVAMLTEGAADARTVILPTTLRVGASCGAEESLRRPS
jgi:LacI family transcriptional regulator